jgi:PEGA domain
MKISCLVFLPFLFFTSCATITRGVHEKLSVLSEPPGAEVRLSSGEKGVTPAKFVKSRRGESFTVTISKPGYTPQTVKVESKGSATGGTVMAANAIAGGIIGIAVDASTGAYNSLYPNPVSVHLAPNQKLKPSKRSSSSEQKTVTKSKPPRSSAKPESSPKAEMTPKPENSPTPEPSATPQAPPTLESSPTP